MIISFSGRIGSGKDLSGNICKILLQSPHLNNSGVETFLDKGLHENEGQWKIRKWADKLKDIVCLILNCSREQLEDREFKETPLGEEWTKFKVVRTKVTKFERIDEVFYFSTLEETEQFKLDNLNYDYFGEIEKIEMTPRLMLQLLGTEGGRNIIHPEIWVNSLISEYKPMIQSTKEEDKRLLSIWKNMNTRCKNPNYEKYHKYGGKGITICKEWEDFQKFRFWALSNGYTNELTLDRINVNGNYEPSNCRFVTSSLQAFNKGSYHQGTSDFKGVNKYSDGRWQAQIQSKGIKKNLGYYQTEEEARKVYQKEYDRINKELEEESFNLQRKCAYPNFIITDTRFENELEAVKDKKGLTIRVSRPCEECNVIDGHKMIPHKINPSEHSSESALDNEGFDYEIINDGTISDLIDKIRIILIENNLINVN